MSIGISFKLNKTFQVGPDKVYNAFIKEDILKEIWGVSAIRIDARPGGKSRAKMEIDGQNWNFTLTYVEVIPGKKLSWMVNFESFPETVINAELSFKSVKEGTEFSVHLSNFPSELERDGNRAAWMNALEKLEKILTN